MKQNSVGIRIAPFAIAIICFLLPFMEFSCSGDRMLTLNGQQLITGTQFKVPMSDEVEEIPPILQAICALLFMALGILLSVRSNNVSAALAGISGLAGVVSIWFMKIQFDKALMEEVGAGPVTIEYKEGFWGFCLAALTGTVMSFMRIDNPPGQKKEAKSTVGKSSAPENQEFSRPPPEKCLLCKHENEIAAQFCSKCGANLAATLELRSISGLRNDGHHFEILSILNKVGQDVTLTPELKKAKDQAIDALATAKANVNRAEKAVNQKHFQKAIEAYDQAVEACADYSPAINGRRKTRSMLVRAKSLKVGLGIVVLGALGVAIQFLIIPTFKGWKDQRVWRATVERAQQTGEDYQKAINIYEDFLRDNPGSEMADLARQQIKVELPQRIGEQEWQKTMAQISAVWSEESGSLQRTYAPDIINVTQKLDEFIRRHPNHPLSDRARDIKSRILDRGYTHYMEEGRQREREGSLKLAMAAYSDAQSLRPNNQNPKIALERVSRQLNEEQFTDAMDEALQAEAEKDWEKAISAYEKALSIKSSRQAKRGLNRVQKNEADARIAALWETASQAEEKSNWVAARRALLEIQKERPRNRNVNQALERIDKAEKEASFKESMEQAKAAEASEDLAKAKALYSAALEQKPGASEAVVALADINATEKPAGSILRRLTEHSGGVTSMIMNPDGIHLLSSAADNSTRIWNIQTGEVKSLMSSRNWYPVQMSANNQGTLFASCSDGLVRWWRDGIARPARSLSMQDGGSLSLAAVPQEKSAAVVGGRDGLIRVIDLSTGRFRSFMDPGLSLANSLVKGLLGRRDNTSGSGVSHSSPVSQLAVAKDGNVVISGAEDPFLKVWDLNSFKLKGKLEGHASSPLCVTISHNGDSALSGDASSELILWDVSSLEIKSRLESSGAVTAVSLSNDGQYALSGTMDGSIALWDLTKEKIIRFLEGHSGQVNAVTFTPDNRWAVSGSQDSSIIVWKLWKGRDARQ